MVFGSHSDVEAHGGVLPGAEPKHDEGWKIHVPLPGGAITDRHCRLLQQLQTACVPHKYVRSPAKLIEMETDPVQKGKFITIYPDDKDQMLALLNTVSQCLVPVNDTRELAPNDRNVQGVASIRYGTLKAGRDGENRTLTAAVFRGEIKPDQAGAYQPEDKTRYKPDHIKDPWDGQSAGFDGCVDHPVFFLKGGRVRAIALEDQQYNPATLRFEDLTAPATGGAAAVIDSTVKLAASPSAAQGGAGGPGNSNND